jgi:hypothetical protein
MLGSVWEFVDTLFFIVAGALTIGQFFRKGPVVGFLSLGLFCTLLFFSYRGAFREMFATNSSDQPQHKTMHPDKPEAPTPRDDTAELRLYTEALSCIHTSCTFNACFASFTNEFPSSTRIKYLRDEAGNAARSARCAPPIPTPSQSQATARCVKFNGREVCG